jgi:hypothetical protein
MMDIKREEPWDLSREKWPEPSWVGRMESSTRFGRYSVW